jgi:NAD(P)H-dependent flavin oxidoreductase YrpB (nitropropane dioxygenase family)
VPTTRFTSLLRCERPVQQAAMGGARAVPLAVAVARAGGLGMLSAVTGRAQLAQELDEVPGGLPVGVNFLLPFLDRGALELASASVPYVELFWGDPDAAIVGTAAGGGAHVGWQVGSVDEARAAADAGCAVVVAQGVEAGGHVRGTTPVLALVEGVRAAVDVVVVAAGGVATRPGAAAAIAAGADAVRVGTRFLTAHESPAHPRYVEALLAASADDTVVTTTFDLGWPDAPHRVLRSAVVAAEARAPGGRSPQWPDASFEGDVDATALYAGISVGGVTRREPAAAIVADLAAAAEPPS